MPFCLQSLHHPKRIHPTDLLLVSHSLVFPLIFYTPSLSCPNFFCFCLNLLFFPCVHAPFLAFLLKSWALTFVCQLQQPRCLNAIHHLPWKWQFNHLPLFLLYVGHSVILEKKICCDNSMGYSFCWRAFQHVSSPSMSIYQQFQKFSLRLMLFSCLLSSWGQEALPLPYHSDLVHKKPVCSHPL